MKTSIHKIKALMIKANKEGYKPILTINGEYIDIDYREKPLSEADKVKLEGKY